MNYRSRILPIVAMTAVSSLVLVLFWSCFATLLVGCTVTPKTVKSSEASFDGDQQNSGLIGYDAAGRRIITAHAVERYNGLIARYGKLFSPPLLPNTGLYLTETNTALMSAQAEFYFATMNRWRKQAGPPTEPPTSIRSGASP